VNYTVRWDSEAQIDLKTIGKAEAKRIIEKVTRHLVKDPQGLGKPLRGEMSGLYRYRISNYRVIYRILKQEIVIEVISVGHRKDVYE
jgi:mRNA interferase RelE/StbE